MEQLYESGKAKAIGVSNFSVKKYVSHSIWCVLCLTKLQSGEAAEDRKGGSCRQPSRVRGLQ